MARGEIMGVLLSVNSHHSDRRFGRDRGNAVADWWYYDRPLRMDADKNGIPCETVYSGATVNAFWFQ
jgi:hypothetical protein